MNIWWMNSLASLGIAHILTSYILTLVFEGIKFTGCPLNHQLSNFYVNDMRNIFTKNSEESLLKVISSFINVLLK